MSKWAILIGIDHYPGLNKADFQGCVRDVLKTSDLLCDTYGFTFDRIYCLTSPPVTNTTEDLSARSQPDSWPSYNNIVRSISHVLREGRPSDIIYIHFSGCVKYVDSKLPLGLRTVNGEDLALVPVDIASNRQYLHAVELAVFLHKLCKRGLDVTIVIDGRFYLIDIPPLKSSALTFEELDALPHSKWTEGRQITCLHLPSPGLPYALLLADSMLDDKGNHERFDPANQEWSGYLTTWIHTAVTAAGPFMPLRSLAQQLRLEASRLKQREVYVIPGESKGFMAAGDMSKLFVVGNRSRHHWPPIFPALMLQKRDGRVIQVGAGSAHGIQLGENFLLVSQPGTKPALTGPELPLFGIFKTEMVRGLMSTAVALTDKTVLDMAHLLDTSDVMCSVMHEWPPVTRAVKPLIHVDNLHCSKVEAKSEQTIKIIPLVPAEQADLYKRLLNIATEDETFFRYVDVTVLGGYRHDSSPIAADPAFGHAYPTFAGGCLHLLSGDFAIVHMYGCRNRELFIHVMSFDSGFGITQLYPKSHDGASSLGDRRVGLENDISELSLTFQLALPSILQNDPQFCQASEVLKIFVTDQRASFGSLEMPRITDEDFLRQFPDPAGAIMASRTGAKVGQRERLFEAVTSGRGMESLSQDAEAGFDAVHWCQDSSSPRNREALWPEGSPNAEHTLKRSVDLGLDGRWCCFDLKFVVHRTIATLACV